MKKTTLLLALLIASAAASAGGNRGPALTAVHPDHHKVRCYTLHCGPDHHPGSGAPTQTGSYYGPDGTQYLNHRVPVDRPPCWTGAKPCTRSPK